MHLEKKVENLQIAYIGGGSRGWAWSFLKDLAQDEAMCGNIRLYDIDKEAARRNQIIGEKIMAHPDAVSHWQLSVAHSLAEALHGVDFIVISILPGTLQEMKVDVHAPEAYGIWQSVGDSVGPGGFVRSVRTVPMYVEIAQAIRDYAPLAWVINYTNPMSVCVKTLYEVFPQIRAFGCCHEVFGTQKLLCEMLEDMCGISGVTRQEIKVNVKGVNHFTWFDSASYQSIDLMPLYAQFAEKYAQTGFDREEKNWVNVPGQTNQRVKFDLFRKYGAIAAAGDRHLAEFMPPWYLKDPKTVEKWGFALTHVDWRIEAWQESVNRSMRIASGQEAVELASSGEEGHLLMKALLGLGDCVSNVNLPNSGQIPNLPLGAVVETNALFRKNAVQPIASGNLPDNIVPLVSRHVYNQNNTVCAAMTQDFSLALTTFLNDPLVNVTAAQGEALLRTMLEKTAQYHAMPWK